MYVIRQYKRLSPPQRSILFRSEFICLLFYLSIWSWMVFTVYLTIWSGSFIWPCNTTRLMKRRPNVYLKVTGCSWTVFMRVFLLNVVVMCPLETHHHVVISHDYLLSICGSFLWVTYSLKTQVFLFCSVTNVWCTVPDQVIMERFT